jgi:hypothetical protein
MKSIGYSFLTFLFKKLILYLSSRAFFPICLYDNEIIEAIFFSVFFRAVEPFL